MFLSPENRVSTRVFVSYLLALIFVIGIGLLAVFQLNRISVTVHDLTNNLAADRELAYEIVNHVLLARFYAHGYVRTHNQREVDLFYVELDELEELIALAEEQISDPERRDMVRRIKLAVGSYGDAFEEVTHIIRERQRIYAEVLDIQEHVIEDNLIALRVHVAFLNDPLVFLAFGNAQHALTSIRLNTTKYLQEGDERYAVQFDLSYRQAREAFSSLETVLQDSTQRENAAQARVAAERYQQGFQAIQADYALMRQLLNRMQDESEPEISQTASDVATSVEKDFQAQNEISQAMITQAQIVLALTTLIAALVGLILAVVIIRRFAEQARSEETLRESEARYRTLFEGVPIGLYRSTPEGQLTDANPTLVHMMGYPDRQTLLTTRIANFYVDPEDRERWRAMMETEGIVRSFEARFRRRDGQVVWGRESSRAVVDEAGGLLHYEGSLEDITEHKQTEAALQETQEQLVRREKLSVLGQMAGSVGHELRNPLGVIANAVYFLKTIHPDADATTVEYLGIISDEVQRSQKIISDLLDFGRPRPADRIEIDVAALLAQALEKRPPPENVQVVTKILPETPPAYVDVDQIGLVLHNLITNAYQAMPQGGKLTLAADAPSAEEAAGTASSTIRVRVSDTGCGISPEHLEKLFEPLFTTKARGIGLGLTLSKRLVEAHGGRIEAQSQEGAGSTFTIYLPTRKRKPAPDRAN